MNTGNADTDADFCLKIMSLSCMPIPIEIPFSRYFIVIDAFRF